MIHAPACTRNAIAPTSCVKRWWRSTAATRRAACARRPPPPELEASIAADRRRLPEVAARASRYGGEPWREKLWYVRARLTRAADRAEGGYPTAQSYLDDLQLLDQSLEAPGMEPIRRG